MHHLHPDEYHVLQDIAVRQTRIPMWIFPKGYPDKEPNIVQNQEMTVSYMHEEHAGSLSERSIMT